MNPINLTPAQLRKAANIKEKIQSLQKELNQILGASASAATTEAPRKKWKMSAAGKAKIAAAARARWARIKGAKSPSAKPAPKRKMSAAAKARLSAMAKARWKKVKAAGKSRL
jgi:hypothetical protein